MNNSLKKSYDINEGWEMQLKASLYEDKALLLKHAQNALANILEKAVQPYQPSYLEEAMEEIAKMAANALVRIA